MISWASNEEETEGKAISHEPAAGIGATVSGLLYAIWAILRASGVEITEDMQAGVEALILVLCGIPAVSGLLIRLWVTPTAKAEAKIDAAYHATPGQDPKPTL